MAFTFTNYAGIKPQRSAFADLIPNILSGYTAGVNARYLQPNLQEELKKKQLYNQYYGREKESEIGLRGAQAGHANALTNTANITNRTLGQKLAEELKAAQFKSQNPLLGMTGPAGQVAALLYLQQHPEIMQGAGHNGQQSPQMGQPRIEEGQSQIPSIMQNQQQNNQGSTPEQSMNPMELMRQSILKSLQPKGAAQYAPSPIGKLQQEHRDIEAGFYPNTNRTIPFESKQKQDETAAPYREKLGGLSGDKHYIFDPESHEKIGIERPYSAKERENEEGNYRFNDLFPDINNGMSDFIGKGAVGRFNTYVNAYGKDPVATQKVDDLLYAELLRTAGVLGEQATLNAGKTNVPFQAIQKSFPKSDIPNLIQRYGKELVLPSEAFRKANERFQEKLVATREKAAEAIPHYKKEYFRPERHLKTEIKKSLSKEKGEAKSTKPHYTSAEVKATAEKYGITEKEVLEKLKQASK